MAKTPIIKSFADRKLLGEIPFYKRFLEEQSNTKYLSALKNYAHSYTAKVLDFKEKTIQLNITNIHFKKSSKHFVVEVRCLNSK